ncbi:hypothetical protein [Streptomyces fulvoviolaceus]|uniref:hypothetical protein n=1 Tax=Streptomyces fulvoviolaceus TaxID=285535 RepID=UPI0004CC2A56|nr:hypothetical protein [Streptomyces fulvoviolaceus]MCT9076298.1 hypothetical protein [Streptomyces fulvoviolaceus]
MTDVSLLRLARTRPVQFALFETLLTGVCALVWYAFAGLLYLESQSEAEWEPDYPPAGPYFLMSYVAALSLPVTWALRCVPVPPLRRFVDKVILVRGVASIAVCVGGFVFAVAY